MEERDLEIASSGRDDAIFCLSLSCNSINDPTFLPRLQRAADRLRLTELWTYLGVLLHPLTASRVQNLCDRFSSLSLGTSPDERRIFDRFQGALSAYRAIVELNLRFEPVANYGGRAAKLSAIQRWVAENWPLGALYDNGGLSIVGNHRPIALRLLKGEQVHVGSHIQLEEEDLPKEEWPSTAHLFLCRSPLWLSLRGMRRFAPAFKQERITLLREPLHRTLCKREMGQRIKPIALLAKQRSLAQSVLDWSISGRTPTNCLEALKTMGVVEVASDLILHLYLTDDSIAWTIPPGITIVIPSSLKRRDALSEASGYPIAPFDILFWAVAERYTAGPLTIDYDGREDDPPASKSLLRRVEQWKNVLPPFIPSAPLNIHLDPSFAHKGVAKWIETRRSNVTLSFDVKTEPEANRFARQLANHHLYRICVRGPSKWQQLFGSIPRATYRLN